MKGLKRALIVLACLALVTLLGYQLFRLTAVEVVGASGEAAQQVAQLLPLAQGDSLLRADEKQIRDAINADGGFICQDVQILWPNRLSVTVTQRVPAGYVETGGQYAVIGQDGYVMRIDALPPERIPQILGLGATNFKVGQVLLDAQDDRLEALRCILDALEEMQYYDQIVSVNVLKTTWLTVTTRDGVVCTLGMRENMTEKFRWIDAAMQKLRQMYDAQALYGCQLDVSSGKSAVFAAHEPIEDPNAAQPDASAAPEEAEPSASPQAGQTP